MIRDMSWLMFAPSLRTTMRPSGEQCTEDSVPIARISTCPVSPKCFLHSPSHLFSIILYIIITLLLLQTTPNVAARRSVVAPNFSISPPKINRARIQYKTTSACEQRELHLNCEPNESIHLVRANYGRFSLSICNDGGRLDLSVMCMSYRSFLIMTDRCSNKSNCSVVVSSKLFGDPCPGTPKYLEVQYHCVRGGVASPVVSSQDTRRPPVQLNIPLLGNTSSVNYPIESAVPTTNSPANSQDNSKNFEDTTLMQNNAVVTTVGTVSKANWSNTDKLQHQHQSALHDKTQPTSLHYPDNVPLMITPSTTSAPFSSSSTPRSQFEEANQFEPINQPLPDSSFPKSKHHFNPNNLDNSFYSAPVEDFCPSVFVRSLFWNWTRKGEVSTQKCPGGATGIVKWQCNFNSELGIAEWYPMRPDFSECRSLWLDNLEERLLNDESVIRIANELALMTLTKPLYSDDLQRISRIIQQSLEHAVSTIQNLLAVEVWHRHQVLKELLMYIVDTISNLLGNGQDDAWLDLNIASRKEVASALIKSLENSALLLAENTNHDGSSATAKPNVLVSVHVLDTKIPISLHFPTYDDISGTNEWTRMEDSIFLPAQSLVDHSHGGLAKVAFFAYYRIEDLLKPSRQTDTEKFESLMAAQLQNLSQSSLLSINSRVIGASISRNGQIQRYPLSQPVTIVLRHIQEENVSSPQCVYWNMDQQNWLSDGCWVEDTNNTHTVCMCNHLTHFALLSEIKSSSINVSDIKLEKLLILSSCFLAFLLFAFITVLIFMTPSSNLVSTSIHRNLCITLFMSELVYLINIYNFDDALFSSFSMAFLHYFLLGSFFWTFFESFDIYMNINSIYEHFKSSKRLYWYYIFAYASPAFIVVVCFMVDPVFYRDFVNFYLRMDNFVYFTFIGPSIGLILGSLVFILFTYILTRNNTLSATTIKCFEDIRGSCSKGLIKWVVFLLLFQCINWSLAFIYLSKQNSLLVSILFCISNVWLSLFVCLFCILKVENIQHSKIFRHLPLPFCHEDSQLSSTKNSTTSDVYSTRPVVTQVTSTQVNGINVHTPIAHSPSTPTATSPVSMSPCLPQPHPLPISHSTQWNYQPEVLNKKSTVLDHQSILAHQDPDYLSYNFGQKKEMKTLPRVLNRFCIQEPALKSSNIQFLDNVMSKKMNKANLDSSSLHRPSNSPRRPLTSQTNENKYIIQAHNMLNLAPNLDHIYECIDTDSMASTLYDQSRRQNNPYGINYRNKPVVNEDDLSSSSIYEDKPLLFSNNSSFWHDNLKARRNLMPHHYHSNASIYDKAPKDKNVIENPQTQNGQLNSLWQFSKESNTELPDLLQKSHATNNLLVSYSGENRFFNKVINTNQNK